MLSALVAERSQLTNKVYAEFYSFDISLIRYGNVCLQNMVLFYSQKLFEGSKYCSYKVKQIWS